MRIVLTPFLLFKPLAVKSAVVIGALGTTFLYVDPISLSDRLETVSSNGDTPLVAAPPAADVNVKLSTLAGPDLLTAPEALKVNYVTVRGKSAARRIPGYFPDGYLIQANAESGNVTTYEHD